MLTLGVVGCDKTENPPSPPTNTTTPASQATITGAAVPIDPLANVENRAQVKEYADETKINPPKAAMAITGFSVQVRESPRGEMVTSTEVAQNVREIAKDAHGDYYLVVFDDPKNPGKQLAGWVYKDALENNGWAMDNRGATAGSSANAKASSDGVEKSTLKLSCAHGESHLRTSSDFCAKTCKDDTGCDKKSGEICDGLGFEVHESTGKMTNSNYCISGASPKANPEHASQHGSSAPLDDMNK